MTIQNKSISLELLENGKQIQIIDRIRNQKWTLDGQSLLCKLPDGKQGCLSPVSITRKGAGTVEVNYQFNGQTVNIIYKLYENFIETTLSAATNFAALALPGSFEPEGTKKYLLPIMQGMLWDTRGKTFEARYRYNGHSGVSMAMTGCLGESGGLLTAAETYDDTAWAVGKDKKGRSYVTNMQESSIGSIRYDRKVRLYPTAPTITAIAKEYRSRVIERGRFNPWKEKIIERPALKRLFGSLLCFIGYCQDDIDYVQECKKLKSMGFDKAFLFPLRFNTYPGDFLMGGYPAINLDKKQTQAIKDLGYDVAPWTWITEMLGQGADSFRRDANGQPCKAWQIDDKIWHRMCSESFQKHQQKANAKAMSDMTWNHFDVLATVHNDECYATNHQSHLGRPLSRTQDRELIRNTLLQDIKDNRTVSSEGFIDAYSMEYDIGSVLAWPQYGPWEYWPIPLTQLVYHDSMIHTWWEVHGYNDSHFGWHWGNGTQFQYGGGRAKIMSAMDALYGGMPFVFPFGAQYAWKSRSSSETFLYKMRINDPETMYALRLAKPVAKLHAKIGMLEMTDFEFLSDDGYVQKTIFEDGTEVYANFLHGNSQYINGIGELLPESWIVGSRS